MLCIALASLTLFSLASCSFDKTNVKESTTTTTKNEKDDPSNSDEKPNDDEVKEITPATWMSAVDDETSLGSIAMPGTHDSGATKEPLSGTAKCQNLTIEEQLNIGVRYFDIRLRRENGKLNIYHGSINQDLSFEEVLNACYTFLETNPSEALIMCIKEEYDATGSNSAFDVMVKKHIDAKKDAWYLENKVPNMGDARGKIVLMRRYGTSGTFGFNASSGWQDNTTFTLKSGLVTLKCQDYYDDESADKKWEEIDGFFGQMKPKKNTYYLNNTSGYVSGLFGIPNILKISDEINPKLLTKLTEEKPDVVGIIATDFINAEIANAIYSLNFDN